MQCASLNDGEKEARSAEEDEEEEDEEEEEEEEEEEMLKGDRITLPYVEAKREAPPTVSPLSPPNTNLCIPSIDAVNIELTGDINGLNWGDPV
jgi:hypothetical protein